MTRDRITWACVAEAPLKALLMRSLSVSSVINSRNSVNRARQDWNQIFQSQLKRFPRRFRLTPTTNLFVPRSIFPSIWVTFHPSLMTKTSRLMNANSFSLALLRNFCQFWGLLLLHASEIWHEKQLYDWWCFRSPSLRSTNFRTSTDMALTFHSHLPRLMPGSNSIFFIATARNVKQDKRRLNLITASYLLNVVPTQPSENYQVSSKTPNSGLYARHKQREMSKQ